ncbi:MAG: rod shape-determining protein MreC [Prevotella sp.]|uniref:rod shape-determining protein MreC n=1 Tax=Prevotella sp. TaxID=59823 RepID=UPI002A2C0750|nr:rod shape-determining protein MreC [Prevotella sp.]MDD7317178.1 rod shape-determining protein MreC [Prevotellaceae bacterium]MDY4019781.1 rod shape-determining protein MreC [Prevotella sp.]
MNNLLAFLAKHNHWLLFVVLEVMSLVLLFRFNSYQGSVWFTSANAVTGKVYEVKSSVESFISMGKLNEQLTMRNVYLERQVKQLSDMLARENSDSTLLRSTQVQLLSRYRLIPAKVVSNSVNKQDNLITIDKGSLDGIRPDMGVVSGNGIVGVVYLVSPHYSIVIPVLNSHSNISVMIDGRGYFGVLHWEGGDSRMAYVDDIPRHARFNGGDNIVTSGYSALFPPGINVGKVHRTYNSPDGMSYRLSITLATDFSNLRDVCVINDAKLQERVNLMRAAKDSIMPLKGN